jgi:hypothetical protein
MEQLYREMVKKKRCGCKDGDRVSVVVVVVEKRGYG